MARENTGKLFDQSRAEEGERTDPKLPTFKEVRPLHARFWHALDEEVDAIQEEDEQQAVHVGSGQRVDGSASRYRFSFEGDGLDLSPGDWIVAELENRVIEGKVVEGNAELTVDFNLRLGPSTPPGEIRPDTAWLTAALRDRVAGTIQALQRGEHPSPRFNFPLALRVLGDGEPNGRAAHSQDHDILDPEELNDEQRQAVQQSLEREVIYVWGPPGTGKSTTIGALVGAHVRAGKTVLVVAASNQAVDVAARQIAQRLPRERLEKGQLLRTGPGVTDRLSEKLRRHVRPEKRMRRAIALRRRREPTLDRRLPGRTKSHDAVRRAAGDRRGDLLVPVRAEDGRTRMEGLHRGYRHVENQTVPRSSELRAEAEVIVTTAHQALLNPTRTELYDTVVVDEASTLSPPTVYLMAGRARRHVIVAGDFHQLPPVTTGPDRRDCLSRDVFEEAGIPDAVHYGEEPDSLVTLRTQYRMWPSVADLSSKLFYSDRLRTARQVLERDLPNTALGHGPLYRLDTGDRDAGVGRTVGGSRENAEHALIVEGLLDYLLLDHDWTRNRAAGPVAVLTPFVGQRELVKSRIRDRYPAEQVPVSTIHGAQGDEYPIVLFDLVDTQGLPVSRYLKADHLTSTGARLLNVGITRASEQLVVIGDFEHLYRRGGRVIQQLVRMLFWEAALLSPEHILRGSKAKAA